MAVAIGIWLALLGYTVAWAGWRNIGITYAPQTDGSVVPSTQPLTLLQAFTCQGPSPAAAAPGSSAPSPATPAPPVAPNPVPVPTPAPIAIQRPVFEPAGGMPRPPALPQPGLPGLVTSILAGAESLIGPVIAGFHL